MDDPSSLFQSIYFLSLIEGIDLHLFSSNSLLPVLFILILLICSGLISASEVAFFGLKQKDINEYQDKEDRLSKTVKSLLSNRKKLLATVLIANNLINIGIIILSTLWFNNAFSFSSNIISLFGLEISSTSFQFTVQVVLVTFLLLLFGEIIPKIFATQNSQIVIKIMAFPIKFIRSITGGISHLLIVTSQYIDSKVKPAGAKFTVDELSTAFELTNEEQNSDSEQKILEGIIKFGSTNVKQTMTSRVDVTAIKEGISQKEVIQIISDSGYSRIPVYKKSFDQITGFLHIKDLLPHLDDSNFKWESLLRKPMFVPESKKIQDLLKEFQAKKMHLAVVVDEYGGASGVISLEDILKEIVGDINDEFDDDNLNYSKLDEHTFLIEGKTSLVDLYRILEIEGDDFEQAKGDSDSLAGFVIEIAERIPVKNERIKFNQYTFIIEAADKRRIKNVKLIIHPELVKNED